MNPVQDLWSAQPLTPLDVQSDKEINSSGGPVLGKGAFGRQSGHAAVGQPASAHRPGEFGTFNIVRCMVGLMTTGVTDFAGVTRGESPPPPRQALNFLRGDGDFFADDICKYWEAGYIMPPIHS